MKIHYFIILIWIVLLTGCRKTGNNQPPGEFIEITDSYARSIRIVRDPRRIVSLSPSITEIIYQLGQEKRLIGRTDYCDYPPEAKNVLSVGSIMTPNIEAIAALKPDLVFASNHFQKETLSILENLSIPVYVGVLQNNYDELYRIMEVIGTVTQTSAKAGELITEMKTRIETIRSRVAGLPKPTVYYMISYGDEGDFTAGKNTYISHLINAAGAVNIGDEQNGWQFSKERLLTLNPDIILCGKLFHTKDKIQKSPIYTKLTAVQEKRIYELDQNLLDRIGYRNLEALETMVSFFHPELTLD